MIIIAAAVLVAMMLIASLVVRLCRRAKAKWEEQLLSAEIETAWQDALIEQNRRDNQVARAIAKQRADETKRLLTEAYDGLIRRLQEGESATRVDVQAYDATGHYNESGAVFSFTAPITGSNELHAISICSRKFMLIISIEPDGDMICNLLIGPEATDHKRDQFGYFHIDLLGQSGLSSFPYFGAQGMLELEMHDGGGMIQTNAEGSCEVYGSSFDFGKSLFLLHNPDVLAMLEEQLGRKVVCLDPPPNQQVMSRDLDERRRKIWPE